MSVIDLCSIGLVTVEPNTTVQFAASLMKRQHVGAVLVVEEKDSKKQAVGILTDRDIVLRTIAEGKEVKGLDVNSIMSKELVKVRWNQGVFEVLQLMKDKGIRRAIVEDKDGRLCGIISADDLIIMLGDELSLMGSIVKSQPTNEEKAYHSSEQSSPH